MKRQSNKQDSRDDPEIGTIRLEVKVTIINMLKAQVKKMDRIHE